MKQERINILGVYFDNVTMDEAVTRGIEFLKTENKDTVFTPNPEIVMEAYHNKSLKEQLNKGSMVIPDGIGIVIGSKIIKNPLKMRVAGYDFVQQLFAHLSSTDKTVYFFGSKEGVAKKAAKDMMSKYPGLKIVGVSHGYEQDHEKVVADIIEKKADLLLVGLGAPRQEQWINDYKDRLPCKMFIGVGGSFDGMAGVVKRAPKLFIKLNLEWFYRLMAQPTRAKRMLRLPVFLFKMIIEGKRYK